MSYLDSHKHQLHGAQQFLRSRKILSWSRNSLLFPKPHNSLPHSHQPNTCSSSKPHESSPHPPVFSF